MSQVRAPSLLQPSPELLAVQKLMPIGKDDRERLKASIEKNGVKDPIKVYSKAGKYYILSGLNRWQIACQLGLELIPIEAIDSLKPKERMAFAIDENLARRQLTRIQKNLLIDHLLAQNPTASSRSIAKQAGADHKTVEAKRKKPRGEIPHLKRQGADGKTYKVSQKGKKSGRELPSVKERTGVYAKGQREKLRFAFAKAVRKHGQGLSRSEIQKELEATLQTKEAKLQTN